MKSEQDQQHVLHLHEPLGKNVVWKWTSIGALTVNTLLRNIEILFALKVENKKLVAFQLPPYDFQNVGGELVDSYGANAENSEGRALRFCNDAVSQDGMTSCKLCELASGARSHALIVTNSPPS